MMNQGRLALLLLILSIKAVQSLILISIFMWFKLIRETLIKREMSEHFRITTILIKQPTWRGLREMDVFNLQEEVLKVLVHFQNAEGLLSFLSGLEQHDDRMFIIVWTIALISKAVSLTNKKKPACTQSKTLTLFGSEWAEWDWYI